MPELPPSAMCRLRVQDGSGAPRDEVVTSDLVTLGSSGSIKISGPHVLPIHARLVHTEGTWNVQPEGAGPVTVNGARVRRRWALESCDRIGLGNATVELLFCAHASPLGPGAHGFSRAKHHAETTLELQGNDRKFVQIIANLEEAISNAERRAVLQRAVELMNDDRQETALAELDRVLAVSPRHAGALLYKSMCMLHLSRADEAHKVAMMAHAAAEGDSELLDEVNAFLTKLRELAPQIEVNRAIKLMNADQFWQARQILAAALQSFPGHASLLFHLAICQAREGATGAAQSSLDQITGPIDPELAKEIGNMRMKLRLTRRY